VGWLHPGGAWRRHTKHLGLVTSIRILVAIECEVRLRLIAVLGVVSRAGEAEAGISLLDTIDPLFHFYKFVPVALGLAAIVVRAGQNKTHIGWRELIQ